MTERFGFRVVPVHPGLTWHDAFHKQWLRLYEHHNHWWRVLGVRIRPRTRHLPLQWKSDESTKHYLTQMLIAINWRYWQARKIHTCIWRFKVPLCRHASLKSIRFLQKKKRSGTFLTEWHTSISYGNKLRKRNASRVPSSRSA